MNIFAKLSWRTMKKSRTRTIVTVTGVILATAMILAVLIFGLSVQQYMLNYAIRRDGNWHFMESTCSPEKVQELTADESVKKTTVLRELGYGDASFMNAEEDLFRHYFYIQTMNREAADMLSVKLSQGRLPENENEIVLQDYMLTRTDSSGNTERLYSLGDEITLTVGDRIYEGEKLRHNPWIQMSDNGTEILETFEPRYERTYTIVGILEHWGNTFSGGGGSDAFTGEIQEESHKKEDEGASWEIYAELKNPHQTQKVIDRLSGSADEDTFFSTNQSVLEWMGISENSAFNSIRDTVFVVLISIIAAGSVFLIYNAFSISFRERVAQFGILASAGASRRQIWKTMFYEALFSGLAGIPLGIISGIAGSAVTLHFIGNGITVWIVGTEEKINVYVSPAMIFMTVIIVTVILFLSAWLPVWKSRKVSPMDAVRSTREIRILPSQVKTRKSVYRTWGIEGMLGDKNYKRDRKKHRAAVAALTMSILLFTSAFLLSDYLKSATYTVMDAPDYEVMLTVEKMDAAGEYIKMIQEAGETEETDSYYLLSVNTEDNFSGSIVWLSDEEFQKYAPKGTEKPVYYDRILEYNMEREAYEDSFLFQKKTDFSLPVFTAEYIQNESGEYTEQKKWEETLSLGQYIDRIPPYVEEYSDFIIFMPVSWMEQYSFQEEEIWTRVAAKTRDYNQICSRLEAELESDESVSGYYVENMGASYQRSRGIRLAVRTLTYGFVILISLIAASSVFNTVSTSILLRKREFAMLRSMGMTKKMLWKMLQYEFMVYTGKAVFYGIVGTMAVDILIYWRMTRGYMNISFIIPWFQFLAAALWAAAVILFTMWMTVRKIDRENIIEELRRE